MTNLSTDSAYLIYFHVTSKFRNVAMFVIFDVEIMFYNILCVHLWFVSIPNLTCVLASSCLSVSVWPHATATQSLSGFLFNVS